MLGVRKATEGRAPSAPLCDGRVGVDARVVSPKYLGDTTRARFRRPSRHFCRAWDREPIRPRARRRPRPRNGATGSRTRRKGRFMERSKGTALNGVSSVDFCLTIARGGLLYSPSMQSFQFHPAVARWFEEKFGSPTEPQEIGRA